ncbi:MAG: hypothetical protein R6U98_29875 [Pirellulaceae bacterium]
MESCPTQAVLPLVGLAAENVIRDRYITARFGYHTATRNGIAPGSTCFTHLVHGSAVIAGDRGGLGIYWAQVPGGGEPAATGDERL